MKHRARRRRGFIILFGWRTVTSKEGSPPVTGRCPGCGKEDATLVGCVRRRWFTLFFIPIFPMEGAAGAHRVTKCTSCKRLYNLPIEQFARAAGSQASRSFSDTIAVYNDLRENPASGAIMLKLLKMYDDLGELGEAETAARHFPAAMAADPACAILLENMRRAAASQ